MSEDQNNPVAEMPNREANPGPAKKGFRQAKKGTKKQVLQENNALKMSVQQLINTQKFLSQQLYTVMQKTKQADEQIQAMADLLRCEEITGPSQDGDKVMLDFSGIMTDTGEPFDGSHMMGTVMTVGENQFLEDFEKQLKGVKVGDTKAFTLTFPEDYFANLAGKEAEFTVKIVKIWRTSESDLEIQKLHEERIAKQKEDNEKESKSSSKEEQANQ